MQHRRKPADDDELYLSLTEALQKAIEIGHGVAVPGSVIFPGSGWDQFAKADSEAFNKFEREQLPWGPLGTPEEIADVAAFLLSERTVWINGANIPVDGSQDAPSAWYEPARRI